MKAIIRLPGLIAFIVVVVLFAAISLIFLDFWIKLAAEKSLEQSTGAEVNIASIEHSFSPFGVIFNHVQLTDPQAPKTNQFEAQSVSAKIDLAPLLLRKLIIDDLSITGVELGTQRENEGEVYLTQSTQEQDSPIQNLSDSVQLPSVDDILANSPLKTTRAIEDAQAAYDKHNKLLKQQYQALPSKEKLSEYQARVKNLTETDYKDPLKLIAAKEEFDALKEEMREDKKRVSDFKKIVIEAKAELSPKLSALKSAPQQDYNQLQSLIAGDADAITDVTTTIFGPQAEQWSQYALAAFEIIGPMLTSQKEIDQEQVSDKGKWINFADTSSLPKLWIKHAQITLNWQQDQIVSEWQDITYQHELIGKATMFSIDSSNGSLWQSLQLNGELWISDTSTRAKQSWTLNNLKLSALDLLNSEKLTAQLNSARLSSTGQAEVNGELVSGSGIINLSSLQIASEGTNKTSNLIASTLNQLDTLKIDTDISGKFGDIDLAFSSDLSKQLGNAALSNLSQEQQQKLDEIKSTLNLQSESALGEKNAEISQWLDWEKLADGDLGSINKLLDAKLDSVIDDKKDELKNKLLDKLKI